MEEKGEVVCVKQGEEMMGIKMDCLEEEEDMIEVGNE